MARQSFDFVSNLAAPAAEVWSYASTMSGVNDELRPMVRMTTPLSARSGAGSALRFEEPVEFHSWLLGLGVLPFDRHHLRIERVIEDDVDGEYGFDELSSSLLQRQWVHRRRITPEPLGRGCIVSDHLEVEPRLRLARPLVRLVVRRLFEHRHRKLTKRHGSVVR